MKERGDGKELASLLAIRHGAKGIKAQILAEPGSMWAKNE